MNDKTEVREIVKNRCEEIETQQDGKDVFEYSVFGSPNQKIGDFIQTKMGDFSC